MRSFPKRRLATWAAAVIAPVLLLGAGASAVAQADSKGDGRGGDPVVQSRNGLVRGVATNQFDQFLGLPYAAPPVRDLRFAPPAAPESWRGIRSADQQAPACLQFEPTGIREEQAVSEDCLYLDVYRPSKVAKNAKLPVMLWFHGGGHTQGTGVIYGGGTMAAKTDTIIISINYRLGCARLPRPPRAQRGHGRRLRQLRPDGPARVDEVGPGQHRQLRRRPRTT